MVAPPGVKIVEYDGEKSKEGYRREGWVEKKVGMSPIRSHITSRNMRGQRKQYGLKHHVTSTVHASMGDTLNKIVTEISTDGNDYCLWDKAQVVVLLRRTKLGVNIIFVGDKHQTINALSSIIKSNNQWTNYMERVIELASVNDITSLSTIPIHSHSGCPFRICDMALPTCNTGFVYMLISIPQQSHSYIGETINIRTRLDQHNSGNGSTDTAPVSLRPYALFAYVCGFDGDRRLMRQFENMWQVKRTEARQRGIICMKQIARLASGIVEQSISNYKSLRLVLLFNE